MNPLLAGVDVGTTGTKVGLYATDGSWRAGGSRPTAATADGVVADVLALLREAIASAGPPQAIGICSMAETGVALDRDLQPLHPLLRWNDPGGDEAERLDSDVGAGRLWQTSGVNLGTKTPLARWLGLRRHSPAILDRMRVWVSGADLVAMGLTGEVCTDTTLAARTGAFDLRARTWSTDLLAHVGLDPGRLPPVTTTAHPLLRVRARELGISGQVPVVIAGHDHLVSAYAAGVRAAGQTADSLGTAEALVTVCATPPDRSAAGSGLSWNGFPGGTGFSLLSGFPDSGRLVDWFCAKFLRPRDYAGFEALARSATRPTGIIVEPYLHGRIFPLPDPDRRLAISGLTEEHGPADLAAALLEGASCQARWVAEEQARVAGWPLGEVTALGGPTRNETWMAIKAAVHPAGIRRLPIADAAGLGAAMLAGEAAGLPVAVPRLTESNSADLLYDRQFQQFLAQVTDTRKEP